MSHYHQYRQQPFPSPSFPIYQQEEEPNYFNPLKENNRRRYNNNYHYYYDDNDLESYNNHYYHHYETNNVPAISRKSSFDNHYYYDIPKPQQNKQNYNKIRRRNIRSSDNNKSRSEDNNMSCKYKRNLELFTDHTTAREPHYFYYQQQDEVPPQLLHYQRLNGVRSVSPSHSTTSNKMRLSKSTNNSSRNHIKSKQEKDHAFRREMNRNPNQSWVQQPNNALNFIAHPPPMMHIPMIQNYGLGVSVTSENWFPPQPQPNNSNNKISFMPQPMIPMIQPSSYIMPDYNNLLNLHGPSLPLMQYPPFPPNNSNNNMLFANLLQHNQHLASTRFSQQTPGDNNNSNNITTTANSIIDPGSGFSNEEERSTTPSSHSVKSEPRNNNSTSPKVAAGLTSDPTTMRHQPHHQQIIKRRRSLMENILSSFSLLGEPDNYTVHPSDNKNTNLAPNDARDLPPLHNNTNDSTGAQKNNNEIDNNNNSNNRFTSSSTSITNINPEKTNPDQQNLVIKQENNNNSINKQQQRSSFGGGSLSRKSSQKLYQKASALQNRDYIWCFRSLQKPLVVEENATLLQDEKKGKWAAFDIENQNILDLQYSVILSKKRADAKYGPKNGYISTLQKAQQEDNIFKPDLITTNDPSLIITLNKQSNLPSPVVVSVKDGIAWYSSKNNLTQTEVATGNSDSNENTKYILLEIAYMPTRLNKLVVSKDSIEEEEKMNYPNIQNNQSSLRRSKSMDGITSKLLNTILKW